METSKKNLNIYGSGPAGLAAALYAVRSGLDVTVFETSAFGGKLNEIPSLDNFPGFPGGPGRDLANSEIKKLKSLGVKFAYSDTDKTLSPADAILLATGTVPKKLDFTPVPPVSYCALCDAPLYRDKSVAVVGSGNSAASGALYLSDLASSVTIFANSDLRAEPATLSALEKKSNIKIEKVLATEENTKDFAAVFVFIGHTPASSMLEPALLDEKGYVKTDETHRVKDNIFAAGSVRSGVLDQCITSAADGAAAAVDIINFLKQ
ncbi:FAD-dependent oxidoreductase [Candidatus Saccharibacteria bacterium]|nr:FAD-dependent oxidoreductase [Candidatus Saccharibacteria bacterium]